MGVGSTRVRARSGPRGINRYERIRKGRVSTSARFVASKFYKIGQLQGWPTNCQSNTHKRDGIAVLIATAVVKLAARSS